MDDAQRLGCKKQELQEAIANEFPSHPHSGPVLEVSHDPSVYEAEGDNLDILLKGRSWRDLDSSFVESNDDEYVLMNERALPVFIGAWLWRAAEDPHLSNQVLSSLVFHLATFGGQVETGSGLWNGGFKGLSQTQREVISLLLRCAADSATRNQDREQIEKALTSVEINRRPK